MEKTLLVCQGGGTFLFGYNKNVWHLSIFVVRVYEQQS